MERERGVQMKVKIYTMTHKHFQKPEDEIYIPLHVGRKGTEDLGYMGDDTGDNISELNWLYGELTGLYWVWKQETEADIIGICHYRRYFLNELGSFMTQEEYEAALSDCDVMVSELLSDGGRNRDNFGKAHNIADMDAVGEAIRKLYPQDYPAFCQVMEDDKCCYGNLMVTSREKYNEYCQWLFSVFDEASDKIDVSGYDMYHKRVYGFLSEVLLYVWVVARGYRVKEGRIGITSEKAETIELKQVMGKLIQEGRIAEAKELFYGYLKLRPDVRENISDMKGELPIIEQLIYIMWEEQKAGVLGLLDFCRDLQILMAHYRNTRKLIEQNGERAREAAGSYFSEFPISDVAFSVIRKDVEGELSLYGYLNEGKPPKKVTVIVAVREKAGVLAGGIGNLVHQTMDEAEIIFVCDALDEENREILQECRRQYPEKVRDIFGQDGCDPGTAWKNAFDAAEGEYISFARAEDIPDPAMCEKLYRRAEECGCDIVDGSYLDEAKNAAVLDTPDDATGVLDGEKRDRLAGMQGHLFGKIVRRELIEAHRELLSERMSGCSVADEGALWNFLLDEAESVEVQKDIVYCLRNV